MPLIQLQTSIRLSEPQQKELLAALSKLTAETIGKPEQYVMAVLQPAAVLMSGKSDPAAFVEVRSIGGLNRAVNQHLTQKVCALLKKQLGLAPERVYLNFSDIPASQWGWNEDTFG